MNTNCASRCRVFWIASFLLGAHAILLARAAWLQSPTLNEPGHLVAGVSNWRFGRFDVYKVNPPLGRIVAAAPVIAAGAVTDWRNYYNGAAARPEFALGEDFVAANGQRSFWLFTLARWACIPFSLLGGYICFRWSRELYGNGAGLLSLALWCFSPNILGHGALITPDVGATALGLAACYTFWRWLKSPTWGHTLLSGLVLGLAELCKTTLVIFYPLWPLLWVVYRWRNPLTPGPSPARGEGRNENVARKRATAAKGEDAGNDSTITRSVMTTLREPAMLAVRMLIGIYVINLGYGFEESCTRLGDFRFVSATLGASGDAMDAPVGGGNRFADSWLGSLPVPFPKNYVLGIDLQRRDFENYGHPSYLRGAFRDKGWWYYYLYALAIKVPLGTWLLIFLAATCGIWRRRASVAARDAVKHDSTGDEADSPRLTAARRENKNLADGATQRVPDVPATKSLADGTGTVPATSRDEFILLAPAVVILAFVSSQTGFSEHMRYVLPIFPFVFIWIGRIVPALMDKTSAPSPRPSPRGRGKKVVTGLAAAALAWSITSSLWVYPHSLSYFNELAGGPTGGPRHLIHSNVDWGQDLLFLKKWLDRHPEARPLKLAYFGYFDPVHAGIEYSAPELPPVRNGQQPEDAEIPPGWYAISVNFVRGLPYFTYQGDGAKTSYGLKELARFQRLEPVAMAGYSIYIYHVPPPPDGR